MQNNKPRKYEMQPDFKNAAAGTCCKLFDSVRSVVCKSGDVSMVRTQAEARVARQCAFAFILYVHSRILNATTYYDYVLIVPNRGALATQL